MSEERATYRTEPAGGEQTPAETGGGVAGLVEAHETAFVRFCTFREMPDGARFLFGFVAPPWPPDATTLVHIKGKTHTAQKENVKVTWFGPQGAGLVEALRAKAAECRRGPVSAPISNHWSEAFGIDLNNEIARLIGWTHDDADKCGLDLPLDPKFDSDPGSALGLLAYVASMPEIVWVQLETKHRKACCIVWRTEAYQRTAWTPGDTLEQAIALACRDALFEIKKQVTP